MGIKVSELHCYPVKSCAGISLPEAEITARGIKHDREWMIVGLDGIFLTQRELPRMSLIRPSLAENGLLSLDAPDMPRIIFIRTADTPLRVKVWSSICKAEDLGEEAAEWLQKFLGVPCRLVRMATNFKRRVDGRYARDKSSVVGFADGFPELLISQASLDDLNTRLDDSLLMNRFRPNVVVSGTEPFSEDSWRTISIGALTFDVVKPCARCTITTVEQETAARGVEPLKTLATYRKDHGRILFGQNLIHREPGTIKVGDEVRVID